MRVDAADTSLVVTDRPIAGRVFGVLSAVAAGFAAWLCLRHYRLGGDWGDLTLVLLAPFLLVIAVAGVWRALCLPTIVCRIDRARRVVQLSKRAPLTRFETSWGFDDIADVRTRGQQGFDDATSVRPYLVLRDGRHVSLTRYGNPDPGRVEAMVEAARRLIAGP